MCSEKTQRKILESDILSIPESEGVAEIGHTIEPGTPEHGTTKHGTAAEQQNTPE